MSVWKSDEKLLSICILNFSFKNDFVWEEISNIRHSVSSPDETPRSSRRIFNSLLGVSSGDETLRLMFDILHQAWDAVFHCQMKHWEESWKYDEQRSSFDELWGVSSGDETLRWKLDITSQTKWF